MAMLTLAALGCSGQRLVPSSLMSDSQDKAAKPVPGPRGVHVDGQALALGQTERGAAAVSDFAQQTERLITDGKITAARRWVHRHPDLALELLRGTTNATAGSAVIRQIAYFHDEQTTLGGPQAGWHAVLLDRAAQANRYTAYDAAREKVMGLLRNGKFEDAAQVDLARVAESTGQRLILADALQVQGVADLVNDQPNDAAASWSRAVDIAGQVQPYQSAELLLLLSEAKRRGGDIQGANDQWRASVVLAADFLTLEPAIADPVYWDRASYLRPVQEPWPAVLIDRLAQHCQQPTSGGAALATESVLFYSQIPNAPPVTIEETFWAAVGDWRLMRHEHQTALVAYKRAQATAGNPAAVDWLRMAQARALMGLEQSQAATAVLMELATRGPDVPVARASLATLGALKVQAGQTQQGFVLLRNALERNPVDDVSWPGQAQSQADLGLCYLLMGDEQAGLHWLAQSQAGFRSQGDVASLGQCLENQAAYFRHNGQKDRAQELETELASLDTTTQPILR
jgi:tetratricopeptide (TPR) repeat protein